MRTSYLPKLFFTNSERNDVFHFYPYRLGFGVPSVNNGIRIMITRYIRKRWIEKCVHKITVCIDSIRQMFTIRCLHINSVSFFCFLSFRDAGNFF